MSILQSEMSEAPTIEKTFPSQWEPTFSEKQGWIQDQFCSHWALQEISNPLLSADAEQSQEKAKRKRDGNDYIVYDRDNFIVSLFVKNVNNDLHSL